MASPIAHHVQPVTADVNELTWSAKPPQCRSPGEALVEDAHSRDQRDDANDEADLSDERHYATARLCWSCRQGRSHKRTVG